jgi:spore germination cell wall hydrolase CwlJ-like protein
MKRMAQPVQHETMCELPSSFLMKQSKAKARDIDILARTLWGEARGEGLRGMEAVACVVLNRVGIARRYHGRYWWGHSIATVCRKRHQFSCWNEGDPNYKLLLMVGDETPEFVVARRIARRAVAGTLEDITGGATHYHAQSVMPYWAKDVLPVYTIGHHVFYRLEEI